MASTTIARPSFAFKRSRPEVAEHKDALLIEFAGFWMETEEEEEDVVVTGVVPATPSIPAPTAMEVDDSVSVITIDSDTEEQAPPAFVATAVSTYPQPQPVLAPTTLEEPSYGPQPTYESTEAPLEAFETFDVPQTYTAPAAEASPEEEDSPEQVRTSFLSTCWDIDNFMDSMASTDMET